MIHECKDFIYRKHALERLLSRSINPEDVEATIASGEVINEYPEDKPFKSFLILGYIKETPLHVVVSRDFEGNCIIITLYIPDTRIWNSGFKTKKK